jgi:hypothetical protein
VATTPTSRRASRSVTALLLLCLGAHLALGRGSKKREHSPGIRLTSIPKNSSLAGVRLGAKRNYIEPLAPPLQLLLGFISFGQGHNKLFDHRSIKVIDQ